VAIEDRVFRYEAKPQPTANAPGKIVEAFGLGKCPKLAEQVCARRYADILLHSKLLVVGASPVAGG